MKRKTGFELGIVGIQIHFQIIFFLPIESQLLKFKEVGERSVVVFPHDLTFSFLSDKFVKKANKHKYLLL